MNVTARRRANAFYMVAAVMGRVYVSFFSNFVH